MTTLLALSNPDVNVIQHIRNDGLKLIQSKDPIYVEIKSTDNIFFEITFGPIGITILTIRIVWAVCCLLLAVDRLYGFISMQGLHVNVAQTVLGLEALCSICKQIRNELQKQLTILVRCIGLMSIYKVPTTAQGYIALEVIGYTHMYITFSMMLLVSFEW